MRNMLENTVGATGEGKEGKKMFELCKCARSLQRMGKVISLSSRLDC